MMYLHCAPQKTIKASTNNLAFGENPSAIIHPYVHIKNDNGPWFIGPCRDFSFQFYCFFLFLDISDDWVIVKEKVNFFFYS